MDPSEDTIRRPPGTERTRVTRHPERQNPERQALYDVLDGGRVAHVAVVRGDGPIVLPLAYARDGDSLLLHGSTGGGLLREAAQGAPIAVTVTLLDELVFARSMFDSSMNYRSAMILGSAEAVDGPEKVDALRILSDHLMPGRWDEVRPPLPRELAATFVLRLPLDETSVKIRTGPPSRNDDQPKDRGWAGTVPLVTSYGAPVAAGDNQADEPAPPSVRRLLVPPDPVT
jgi:nitroimidazol reductase NimA-like FMN-containing flavoprotein (pyridoxamine 5'-phosphate oxidase superfamily)